ncbi:MAG: hypothetical protein HYS04_20235 [Acidobacteria bacterium]|nr:hypothetical protein [Acidobacteriota bacterium]
MDEDRKYRQRGYMDSDRRDEGRNGAERPRVPQGPRTLQDPNGPRLPRLVQAVAAARCHNCSTALPAGTDFPGNCPKCNAALHCCKQCAHFEPSTRFQCLKPIKVRVAIKDQTNECELFSPRVTVSRDGAQPSATPLPPPAAADVKTPRDARAAFDNLFKK